MTPQQLKNAILQQAIQGKLVEQKAEEGTGEELYKAIQDEMQKLIQEGKLKKQKALPDITEDEIPFEIPETWKWVRLGEIISIESGNGLTTANMIKGNIPVYGGNGITGYHNESTIHEKTIVIGRVGYYCGSIHITEPEAWVTDNAFVTKYPKNFIDMMFLVHILRYMNLGNRNNATAQPVISGKKIYPLLFPLPPLDEQKRIVEKIEELLPLVERYEKAWSRLEELNKKFPLDMQKAILGQAIQGKLVEQRAEEGTGEELFEAIQNEKQQLIKEGKLKKQKALPDITEDEIPFEIPETWKWVRLGELSKSVQYGYNAPAKNKGRIKMVRISDIQDDSVCWDTVPYCDIREEEIEQYLLKNNDILFARTGGTVGKSFLVKNINENAIYAGYLIRTQYGKNIVPQFLKYFMGSELYWSQLRIGTIATAQPNCNGQTLSKMILPLPPLAEQTRIVEKIEELLPLVEKLK